jgi:osmotically-inducible protein OsmY
MIQGVVSVGDSRVIDEAADRDLEQRVVGYLARRHVPSLRQLAIEARNGIVTVRGQVRSFYEKQLSSHCCRRVAGVVELVDEIHVVGGTPIPGAKG